MINTLKELYDKIVEVTTEDQRGNWTSDLHCKVTKDTMRVIDQYKYRHFVKVFHSAIDGTLWYEIPFAFTPWWSDPYKHT